MDPQESGNSGMSGERDPVGKKVGTDILFYRLWYCLCVFFPTKHYRLNVYVLPNSSVEILTLKAMVSGGGGFGR